MPEGPPAIIEYLLPSFIVSERGDGSAPESHAQQTKSLFRGGVGGWWALCGEFASRVSARKRELRLKSVQYPHRMHFSSPLKL